MNPKKSTMSLDSRIKDPSMKAKMEALIHTIKQKNSAYLRSDLEYISEIIDILGMESDEAKSERIEGLSQLQTELDNLISEIIELHSNEFNSIISNIGPFSQRLEKIFYRVKTLKKNNEECKSIITKKVAGISDLSYKDVYFTEMIEGIENIELFYKEFDKFDSFVAKNKFLQAASSITFLQNNIEKYKTNLQQNNIYSFMNDKCTERFKMLVDSLEVQIMDFVFMKDNEMMSDQIESLYMFYKSFLLSSDQQSDSIFEIFGRIISINSFVEFLEFTFKDISQIGEYMRNPKIRQILAEKIENIEDESVAFDQEKNQHFTNIYLIERMRKIIENIEKYVGSESMHELSQEQDFSILDQMMESSTHCRNSMNIPYFALLLFSYFQISNPETLMKVINSKLQEELRTLVLEIFKNLRIIIKSERLAEENYFKGMNISSRDRQFLNEIIHLNLPDIYHTLISLQVSLSLIATIIINFVYLEYIVKDIAQTPGHTTMEAQTNIDYYLQNLVQIIFEYEKWIKRIYEQDIFEAGNPEDQDNPHSMKEIQIHRQIKDKTLRFSVKDIQNYEAYIRDSEKINLEFIQEIANQIQEVLTQNIFLVPIVSNIFVQFQNILHKNIKAVFYKSFQSSKISLIDQIHKTIDSNYSLFISQFEKHIIQLTGVYLQNTNIFYTTYTPKIPFGYAKVDNQEEISLSPITKLSYHFESLKKPEAEEIALQKINRIESLYVFGMFVKVIQYFIINAPAHYVVELFKVLLLYLIRIRKKLILFMGEITKDTHYLTVFGQNYYNFERNAFYLRNFKYKFKHLKSQQIKDPYYDDKLRNEIEKIILSFKQIAPLHKTLQDMEKIKTMYNIHENIYLMFEDIDNLFKHISHSIKIDYSKKFLLKKDHFDYYDSSPDKPSSNTDNMDEILLELKKNISKLETTYTDSIIVIKTEIINLCLYYIRETSNDNMWKEHPLKVPNNNIIKLVRELKLIYNTLQPLLPQSKLFYLFNYCERMIMKLLRHSIGLFRLKQVNQNGYNHFFISFNYIRDNLSFLQNLKLPVESVIPQKKKHKHLLQTTESSDGGNLLGLANAELRDFTFSSFDDEVLKTEFFLKLLEFDEGTIMLSLRESKFKYSPEEIDILLDTRTHAREPLNPIQKQSIKNIIFKGIQNK